MIAKLISLAALALSLILASASIATAERAQAPKLLPRETLAYVRLANVPDAVDRFLATGTGRMFQDPQLRPLVSDTWATIKESISQVQEQLGMSLDEIIAIPRGEIAFGVFRLDGQDRPGLALIVDCGDQLSQARKLFSRLKELAESSGERRIEEQTIAGTTVTVFSRPGGRRMEHVFEKEGTFVLCPDPESAKAVITHWEGRQSDSFENNAKFGAVMKACQPGRDEQPQLTWFVDPIGLADQFAQGNAGARIGLAMLPALGLDGLNAVGGSMTFAAGDFDMVNHIHVLLALPRAGVLAAIALDSGDLTPEKWVPADVANYMTVYWDFQKTYDEVQKLIDSFRGQGATADWTKIFVADRIGVDPVGEVLPKLTGRVTITSQVMKPVNLASTAQLLAIELKDSKEFEPVLDKVVKRISELSTDLAPEKKSFGGTSYYRVTVPPPPNYHEGDPLPEPTFAIVQGYLMISDREAFLKKMIAGNAESSLGDELDFKLIANKATRAVGEAKPGMLGFNRPEEGLRYLYDLANAEQSRKRIEEAGQKNKFFQSLGGVLERNPLPPFSTLEKYIAPAGSAMTNDDTGIHYVSFSLRRK